MTTSKMAVTTMAYFVGLASKQHFVLIEIIIDSPLGSQFEYIVLVIGGFQMSMILPLPGPKYQDVKGGGLCV